MLENDSVTVACEVPIYLDSTDIEHFREKLGFLIPLDLGELGALTGHIDILQIRNGAVHILDYKPNARKEIVPMAQRCFYAIRRWSIWNR